MNHLILFFYFFQLRRLITGEEHSIHRAFYYFYQRYCLSKNSQYQVQPFLLIVLCEPRSFSLPLSFYFNGLVTCRNRKEKSTSTWRFFILSKEKIIVEWAQSRYAFIRSRDKAQDTTQVFCIEMYIYPNDAHLINPALCG